MGISTSKPSLRFRGFDDAWEWLKLGEISSLTKGQQLGKTLMIDVGPYYVLNGGVSPSGYTDNWNTKEDTISISEGGNSCGFVNYNTEKFWSGGHNYTLNNLKIEGRYLYQFLKYNESQIMALRVGSGLPNVQKSRLSEVVVSYPSITEQQKIAGYFFRIDNLTTIHQRKHAKLISIKQALLEKMFPKQGEVVPQIRFRGFADTWEQCKLIDMLQQPVTDGPHETPGLVENGIPFISVDAIVDNKIDFSKIRGFITESYDVQCSRKYKPQINDVYLVKSGSTVGKVAIVETDKRFNIWSPLAALRTGEISDPYYLYHLLQTKSLQTQVFDRASHGTQPNLSMRELEKFDVCVPKIQEQRKISRVLGSIDKLITLHQRKYEKLINIKKALLERMFVQ